MGAETSRSATKSLRGGPGLPTRSTHRYARSVIRPPRSRAARDVLAGLVDEQDEQRRLLIWRSTRTISPPPNWMQRSATRSSLRCWAAAEVRVSSTSGACSGCSRRAACPIHDRFVVRSILGSVVARGRPVPIEEYVAWAKTVSYRAILGTEQLRRRTGWPACSRCASTNSPMRCSGAGRRAMRMSDLAIPFDAVVAGVRRQPYAALPSRFRRPELAALQMRSLPFLPIGSGPRSRPGSGRCRRSSTCASSSRSSSAMTISSRVQRRRRSVLLVGDPGGAAP